MNREDIAAKFDVAGDEPATEPMVLPSPIEQAELDEKAGLDPYSAKTRTAAQTKPQALAPDTPETDDIADIGSARPKTERKARTAEPALEPEPEQGEEEATELVEADVAETAETQTAETQKPAESKIKVGDREYTSTEVEALLVASQNQQMLNDRAAARATELRGIHDELRRREAESQRAITEARAMKSQVDGIVAQLLGRQAAEGAGADAATQQQMAAFAGHKPAEQQRALTMEDVERIVADRLQKQNVEQRAQQIKSNWASWAKTYAMKAGLPEELVDLAGWQISGQVMNRADATRTPLIDFTDGQIQNLMIEEANKIASGIRQFLEKNVADRVKTAAGKAKTFSKGPPKVSGTPLPDHSSPARGPDAFEKEWEETGSIDAWAARRSARARATIRENARNKKIME